jgi:hypothetical protein
MDRLSGTRLEARHLARRAPHRVARAITRRVVLIGLAGDRGVAAGCAGQLIVRVVPVTVGRADILKNQPLDAGIVNTRRSNKARARQLLSLAGRKRALPGRRGPEIERAPLEKPLVILHMRGLQHIVGLARGYSSPAAVEG